MKRKGRKPPKVATQNLVPLAEQERLERLLRKHRKKLLAVPNVHHVDIGFEYAGGRETGKLALRVHVDKKRPTRQLKPRERVPEFLEGIPVDVIESNPSPQLDRDDRHNPAIGGVQIRNTSKSTRGTLGIIVMDRDTLQPLALSNHHVMVRVPAVASDVVSQPGSTDAADTLGRVVRFNQSLDCAVCAIGSRSWTLDVFGLGSVNGWATPRLGQKIMKSGNRTGVTWGKIDGIDATGFTVVPDTTMPSSGQLSLPGDSGSIWIDLVTNQAVGLHFAGNSGSDPQERAFAKRIGSVLSQLNVLIFDGAAIGRAFIGGSGHVLARTTPGQQCHLRVVYPSGRVSSAKGLGNKRADANGWVEWRWTIGTHTRRKGAGPGRPFGIPMGAIVTLGGTQRVLERPLEGTTHTN